MKKYNNIFNILVFVVFIFIIIIMGLHHENWRDEAQAYLLCRDMNIIDLFKNVHYEGHPIIYYLLLEPLVFLGPKSVNILSFILISISVYLILFKSNLNNIGKLCIILTYPVIYEFSIIGRSYSLCFLLLTIYSLLYSNRNKYPISFSIVLGLLLNTHLLMMGFVFINTIFYIKEIFINKNKDKNINIGFIIIIISFILLVIQFIPMLFISNGMSIDSSYNIINYISMLFVLLFGVGGLQNIYITILSIIILFITYIYIFKKNKYIFIILIFSYIYMSILMTYIFSGVALYTISLASSMLYICMIIINDKNITILLVCLVFINLFINIKAYYLDYNYNYSSSYELSNYINNNISKDSIFICNNDSMCSSIILYVNNKFYSSKTNNYFTYIVWNKKRESNVDIDKLYNYINNNSNMYYIVSDYNIEEDTDILNKIKSKYKVDKIYTSSKSKSGTEENYYLYKIGGINED